MEFEKLSPHIRFIGKFNYYPKETDFVIGYDYRIFYITDGKILLNFKDITYKPEKYSLIMIPSGTAYNLQACEEKNCEILCVNFDCVRSDLSEKSVHPVSERKFDPGLIFEDDRIAELERRIIIRDASALNDKMFELLGEFQKKQFGYRQKGESILADVLVSLVRTADRPLKKEAHLAQAVKEYLIENLSEQCDADTIGERFHYHPNYVNRVFKENIGTTIHNFLINKRIEAARELLITSNLSLEKISLKCGFKTPAHFSQCFKSICGVSPSAFRKSSDSLII